MLQETATQGWFCSGGLFLSLRLPPQIMVPECSAALLVLNCFKKRELLFPYLTNSLRAVKIFCIVTRALKSIS